MTTNPPTGPARALGAIVEGVARLLPAQGPIRVFVHHNPLHAFEHLPFEQAAVSAGELLGCRAFLSEDRYRAEHARGRISQHDLSAVLDADLGARGAERVAVDTTRRQLWLRLLLHGIPVARGEALQWLLHETGVTRQLRADLPADARQALADAARRGEAASAPEIWDACLHAASRLRLAPTDARSKRALERDRDLLLAACGVDIDESVHPVLIRFTGAYLDQDSAQWPLRGREHGMHRSFVDCYATGWTRLCAPWGRRLCELAADDRAHQRGGLDSLHTSLRALGIEPRQWERYLRAEALALRGWAGMVRQLEEHPDRAPARVVPATLVDYLAVRLLLLRAALASAADEHFEGASLSSLRQQLSRETRERGPGLHELAWPLFHAAQLCGLGAGVLAQLGDAQLGSLHREIAAFDQLERCRLWHLAYERHLRHELYGLLVQHAGAPAPLRPRFQAVFCIDEREESFRRHLEEVEPGVETLGTAGFFGVAMYFRGQTDAHPRPLCPIAITPRHFVEEISEELGTAVERRRSRRRLSGRLGMGLHVGSRTLVRGALVAATLGLLSLIPLVLRVLLPGLRSGVTDDGAARSAAGATRLQLDRSAGAPPVGAHIGFTVDEMADIVEGQLTAMGIAHRLAPLVLLVGHGSVSLNNPHESAHDCGACGGGRGGPNARALALMANDPRVRAALDGRGIHVSGSTWFVGAERNTCSNGVTFFDTHLAPVHARPLLSDAMATFDRARAREALERCRRFESAPRSRSEQAAIAHVQQRSADLAQPRPEYGHASNAFCVVGRRRRTRGLFLDRRAFLVSYDATLDRSGDVLERLLGAVVPVVVGINLEYYFGSVDPGGYGSGTKLPHNVSSLLGVMDGAQSDLRTGLPWQMLEIHEPVRLSLVVECEVDRMRRVLHRDAGLARLVDNRWLTLACLSPDAATLHQIDASGVRPFIPDRGAPVMHADSIAYIAERDGALPLARLDGPWMRTHGC